MKLDSNQVLEAWRMRARHVSWIDIAAHLGCTTRTVRNTLYPYRGEETNERARRYRRQKRPKVSHKTGHLVGPVITVPEYLWAERAARMAMEPRSIIAALMGDPPFGRSALDKRRARVGA